jgi:probable addiction module antidote protein
MPKHRRFDEAEYLKNDGMIAEYLRLAAERGDETHCLDCLSDALRARSINQLAGETGIDRDKLWKLFSGGGAGHAKATLAKVSRAISAPALVG